MPITTTCPDCDKETKIIQVTVSWRRPGPGKEDEYYIRHECKFCGLIFNEQIITK